MLAWAGGGGRILSSRRSAAYAYYADMYLFPRPCRGGDRRSLPLDPSPLEAFARQASTRIVRSDEITRLDTTKGHVVITAIVLENSAQPPDQMRGVRISLSQAGANDQVYVGESILPELRDALNEIAEGLQSERKKPTCESAACYIGSCRFRRLDGGLPQVHS